MSKIIAFAFATTTVFACIMWGMAEIRAAKFHDDMWRTAIELSTARNERDELRASQQDDIDAFKAALKEANDRAAMWLQKLSELKKQRAAPAEPLSQGMRSALPGAAPNNLPPSAAVRPALAGQPQEGRAVAGAE